MKKVGIIIVIVTFLIAINGYYFVHSITKQWLSQVEDADLEYIQSLGFKENSYIFDVTFTSEQFPDLTITINEDGMYGYQPYGVKYQEYIINGGFYLDGSGVDYSFDIFPYVSYDDQIDNSYRMWVNQPLTGSESYLINQDIISICNDFINMLEPLVSYDYKTEFYVEPPIEYEFDIFDQSTYTIIENVEQYQKTECADCDQLYIKDNFSYQINADKLNVTYYDPEIDLELLRYDDGENIQYYFLNEGQEITIGNDNIQFDYLKPELTEQMIEYIEIVNYEYQQALPILIGN